MKKIQKTLTALGASAGSFFAAASVAAAQITNPVLDGGPLESNAQRAVRGQSFAEYFIHLWSAMLAIGAILVLIFLIWGAVEWITSAGEKGKLENARNRIMQAIIGLIVLVGSFALIGFLSQLIFGDGFNILEISFPNAL